MARVDWFGDIFADELEENIDDFMYAKAKDVRDTAQSIVKKRTGELSRRIDVRVSRFKDGGLIVEAQGKGNYAGKWYAGFVELGTYKDPKQPYMRPSLEIHRSEIENPPRSVMPR